jgi:hypothetical protein
MGVRLVNLASGQSLVAIARNAESAAAVVEAGAGDGEEDDPDADGSGEPAAGSSVDLAETGPGTAAPDPAAPGADGPGKQR